MSVGLARNSRGVHARVAFLRRHPIARYTDFGVAVARSKHPDVSIVGPMLRKTRVDGGEFQSTVTGHMHK